MTLTFRYLGADSNGDAAIAGRGLRVYTILGEYEMGMSVETIADEYDIPIAAVHEALAYAAEHPEEMEAITREDKDAEERWLVGLPEHLRQIAIEGIEEGERSRQEAIRKGKQARCSTPVS